MKPEDVTPYQRPNPRRHHAPAPTPFRVDAGKSGTGLPERRRPDARGRHSNGPERGRGDRHGPERRTRWRVGERHGPRAAQRPLRRGATGDQRQHVYGGAQSTVEPRAHLLRPRSVRHDPAGGVAAIRTAACRPIPGTDRAAARGRHRSRRAEGAQPAGAGVHDVAAPGALQRRRAPGGSLVPSRPHLLSRPDRGRAGSARAAPSERTRRGR